MQANPRNKHCHGINAILLVAFFTVIYQSVQSLFCVFFFNSLQCFDAVGWAAGRASGL